MNDIIGRWAFIIGLIIAILAGFITNYSVIVAVVLFVLGLLVGILNITEKTAHNFLLGVAVLLLLGVASLNALSVLGIVNDYLIAILSNFIAFVGAAGLIVSIKAIIMTSKK